jgi:shikimate dehydrogenase
MLAARYPGLLVETGIRESRPFDLLVNATPLGMREDDPIPIPQTMLRPGRLVADIVMTPARTPLLHRAETLGCEIHFGEPMLLAQMPRMLRFFAEPLSDSYQCP